MHTVRAVAIQSCEEGLMRGKVLSKHTNLVLVHLLVSGFLACDGDASNVAYDGFPRLQIRNRFCLCDGFCRISKSAPETQVQCHRFGASSATSPQKRSEIQEQCTKAVQ